MLTLEGIMNAQRNRGMYISQTSLSVTASIAMRKAFPNNKRTRFGARGRRSSRPQYNHPNHEVLMPKNFIGVIRGANSGTIYAVVNPNDDSELDNPRLLLLGGEKAEAMEMVKV